MTRQLIVVLAIALAAPAVMAAGTRAKPNSTNRRSRSATQGRRRAPKPRTVRSTVAGVTQSRRSSSEASVLRFNASHHEVQTFVRSKKWDGFGWRFAVTAAKLVYTTDGWKTTKVADVQYLADHHQGFLLRGVPKGTPIEYAIEATVVRSHDNFRSYADRATFWVNNGGYGVNHRAVTEPNPVP